MRCVQPRGASRFVPTTLRGPFTALACARRFAGAPTNGSGDSKNPGAASEEGSPSSSARSGAGAAFAQASSTPSGVLNNPASVYTHTIISPHSKPLPGVASSSVNASDTAVPPPKSYYRGQPLQFVSKAGSGPTSTPDEGHASAKSLEKRSSDGTAVTNAKPEHGPMVPDYGPLRATGLWKVDEVIDEQKKTVDFRKIDEVESDIIQDMHTTDDALVPYDEEERWKHKLMFVHKFKKTPKHLTWKELGEEIECLDCTIDVDEHRPEEMFTITFHFTDKKTGTRDIVWSARNDVSYSEGFTDLLAAVGACLGRADVHRTIRFDDGLGTRRDLTIRKRSRYTSDIQLAFRPAETYNKFQDKADRDEYEESLEAQGMSTWGFHPALMDPEFNDLDFKDPEGTYELVMSAHALSFVVLKGINRLLARPMKEFYRPSQLMRTAKVRAEDDLGLSHAIAGWLGAEEQIYPHYTPIEAIQEHWLGRDAPFSITAIVNKLREMTYMKRENPEFQSWLAVRQRDTHLAIRNLGVKLLGVGASTLFFPVAHNATVNRLLPKNQQRRLESRFSLNAMLNLPDETRRIDEFKQITGHSRLSGTPVDESGLPKSDGGRATQTANDAQASGTKSES